MADSDPVVSQRQTFYVGDINYRSALSEALLRKFASSNNFINDRIVTIYPTHFGGYFRPRSVSSYSEPMIYVSKNALISWYTLSIGKTSSAGDNHCNFKVIDASGAILGDFFSTPPRINEAGLDNSVVGRDIDASTAIQQVTTAGFDYGTIDPAYTTLLEGWKLRPYVVGNATNSLGMTLTLAVKIQE